MGPRRLSALLVHPAGPDPMHADVKRTWSNTISTPSTASPQVSIAAPSQLDRPNRANRPNHPNRRLLRHRQSRRKLRLARRLARKQDKYQLKTWDHYVGEA